MRISIDWLKDFIKITKTTEEISKATGGLGIPGFKWPL